MIRKLEEDVLMKKYLVVVIFILSLSLAATAWATQDRSYNFSTNYTLTGDGPTDMASIAAAQNNKTTSDLGYSELWCADFVSDCARLAGQSAAIPASGSTSQLKNNVLNAGGQTVSTPQNGDLVFYYCNTDGQYTHVGLMTGSTSSIQGNLAGKVQTLSTYMNYKHHEDTPSSRCYTVSFVRPAYKPKVQTGYLDVNGILDGVSQGSTGSHGTFDVYINGSLQSNDVNDYCVEWPVGTTYQITDFRATSNHRYDGISSGSAAGTITEGITSVSLAFSTTAAVLDVDAILDGTSHETLGTYGTVDVYIDNVLTAEGVTEFNQTLPVGTSYEFRVSAADGKIYNGVPSGSLTGTVSIGGNVTVLSFSTYLAPTSEWQYVDALPDYIDPETCDIEYNNHYTAIAQSSPGEGYQNIGFDHPDYINSGSPYVSDFELPVSETRVLLDWYYYHYCGASDPTNANYTSDSTHVHFDAIYDVNSVSVAGTYTDKDDSRYIYYALKKADGSWARCKTGYTCDGEYGTHGERSYYYYRRYTYQDKTAINYYKWEKYSGWIANRDPAASDVSVRYRLKDNEAPEIQSMWLTDITPDGYTAHCIVTDNTSVTSVLFSTSPYTVGDNPVQYEIINQHAVFDQGQEVEVAVRIKVSDNSNIRDCWYQTMITVFDSVNNMNGAMFEDLYIPTLVHGDKQLEIPDSTTVIEEEAFAGDTSLNEVVLPVQLDSMGSHAFAGCSELTIVYMPETIGSLAGNAFEGCPDVVLICRDGSDALTYAKENHYVYLTGE